MNFFFRFLVVPVPMIPLEDTTIVSVEDFEDFFGNPNYLYRPRVTRAS